MIKSQYNLMMTMRITRLTWLIARRQCTFDVDNSAIISGIVYLRHFASYPASQIQTVVRHLVDQPGNRNEYVSGCSVNFFAGLLSFGDICPLHWHNGADFISHVQSIGKRREWQVKVGDEIAVPQTK